MSVEILSLTLAALVLGTFTVRVIPFYTARGVKDHPLVDEIGLLFPAVTMPLLLLYCLKDVSFATPSYGSPEIIGVIVVVLLHIWKRQVFLSIAGGLSAYWFLADYLA